MAEILNTILIDTFTLTQLKHRVRILRGYLLKIFFNTQDENETISAADLNWLKTLPENFYQNFNKDNVYSQFESLNQQISKLTPLTIYLTFDPDDEAAADIGQFARKTFDSLMLLDTKKNQDLIAGCAIIWKGVYKDYSLKAQIEEKKEQILSNFKKYLR